MGCDVARDVDAGCRDGVAELHRVVDLVDEQAPLRAFEQVDSRDVRADGCDGTLAQVAQLGRHFQTLGCGAAGGVGDPVPA